MFYKNSQNCKVQSSFFFFFYTEEPQVSQHSHLFGRVKELSQAGGVFYLFLNTLRVALGIP